MIDNIKKCQEYLDKINILYNRRKNLLKSNTIDLVFSQIINHYDGIKDMTFKAKVNEIKIEGSGAMLKILKEMLLNNINIEIENLQKEVVSLQKEIIRGFDE